ncbi:hypothetical protein [Micromonospora sp. NPDC005652]|uniref:hypothetical protein n=1 Tax=Micromonospora sp. NPDC005652 TaxID=3157046 RepID=UPI003406C99E
MSLIPAILQPAERAALALYLDNFRDDPALAEQMARAWEASVGSEYRTHAIERMVRVLRAAAVDPGLLRWCDWPDCLASYAAHPGPTERGWMRHPYALLCPAHAPLGHGPTVRWDGDVLTAHCSCSASAVVSPTNGQAVKAWWRTHVAEVTG